MTDVAARHGGSAVALVTLAVLMLAGTGACGAETGLQVAAGTGLPPISAEGRVLLETWSREIALTAAPGQFESAVITLAADAGHKGVRVEAGDLTGPAGAVIPGSKIRLHRVRSRGAKARGSKKIVVYPEFLFPLRGDIDLKKGEPGFVWVTVGVPEDAATGEYSGELGVICGVDSQTVRVRLRVLPFKPVKPKIVLAMLYSYEFRYLERYEADYEPAGKRRARSGREGFLKRGRRAVRDMAEHGMNTIFPHSSARIIERDGKPYLPDVYASMDAARAEGMDFSPGWVVGWLTHAQWKDIPKFNEKKDVAMLKRISAEAARAARERGFKEVIITPSDEPNHERKLPVARKLLAGAGRIDGVRWAITGLAPTLKTLSDLYDIGIIAGGTPEDWAELKRRGKELWIYDNNATTGRDPVWSRFVYGLLGWRAGFDGVTSWTYPPDIGDFKGRRTDARDGSKIATYTPEGEPVTTVIWEAIRDGITDRRYIDTLKAEIERARSGGFRRRRAAARAQKVLDGLWERVDPDLKSHDWKHTEYGSPRPKGFDWQGLEKARAEVVAAILKLKGLR